MPQEENAVTEATNPAQPIFANGYDPGSVEWYTTMVGYLFMGASLLQSSARN